jgi:hypothetical protein
LLLAFITACICFSISIVLFIVFFKLLNAAFFKEHLMVSNESITVIRKYLSNIEKHVFNLSEITYLGFSEQQYTKHTMDNPIVDFTGLATQEKELQYVIDEGNILLVTNTSSVKFGKNMPSWDIEEVIEKIETFTSRKFVRPMVEYNADISPEETSTISEANADSEVEQNNSQIPTTKHSYIGTFGELIIEQKGELPASEDMAYINGNLAPTGKYQIGDKQFVLVSNGMIYAVRL